MGDLSQKSVSVSPRATAVALSVAAFFLLLMHLALWRFEGTLPIETVDKALTRFNLNSEQSVPAWFSSMLLLLAAGLLAWTAARVRHLGLPDRWRWLILAAVFVCLSADESASFHEMLSAPVRERVYGDGGIFRYAWVIPGIIGCVVLGAFYLPMIRRLPRRTRRLIILAGAAYLGGALACEMVSAWFFDRDGYYSVPYKIAATCEEMMEIAGLIIFIYALMDQLTRLRPTGVASPAPEPAMLTIQPPARQIEPGYQNEHQNGV